MIFSCFTQKLKEKVDGLLGGPKGMLATPFKLLGGGGGLAPPGPPSSYAYGLSIYIDKQVYTEYTIVHEITSEIK